MTRAPCQGPDEANVEKDQDEEVSRSGDGSQTSLPVRHPSHPRPDAQVAARGTAPAWGLPAGLAAMPVWRMALWCVPTLGLYLWLWLGLRREAFNSLDSPCKVWKWLFWTSFWMGLASGLFDAEPRPEAVFAFRAIGLSLSVAGSLAYLFLLFCAKAALEDHMEAQGLTLRASRWWLLLFGALYLQHVINRAHALLNKKLHERAALQTGPIAASTPP